MFVQRPIVLINDESLHIVGSLRAWYEDWSETARAVITRRDHLIRLGLAKRKKAAKRSPGAASEQSETTG